MWLFTAPWLTPIASAVCASERSQVVAQHQRLPLAGRQLPDRGQHLGVVSAASTPASALGTVAGGGLPAQEPVDHDRGGAAPTGPG